LNERLGHGGDRRGGVGDGSAEKKVEEGVKEEEERAR
jgi:hypothetical protein